VFASLINEANKHSSRKLNTALRMVTEMDVVTKDVPYYAVVGGVPAKVIRMQEPSEQRE
jgi:hypothetical protein